MTELVPTKHTHPSKAGTTVVEIWHKTESGQTFIGTIYPTDRGVKIVSKYIENRADLIWIDVDEPPAVIVNIKESK